MKRAMILAASVFGAALFVSASVQAVPIHVHEKVPVTHERVVGADPDGLITVERTKMKEVVRVVHVAPVDEDNDGIADVEDSCIGTCESYEPTTETNAVAPIEYSSASNSTVMCESGGDYSANTGNGYYGGYQFDSGTWDAYGDPAYGEANEAPAAVQDAAAASVPYDAWPNC